MLGDRIETRLYLVSHYPFAYVSGRLHSSAAHWRIVQGPSISNTVSIQSGNVLFPTRSETSDINEAQIFVLSLPGPAALPTHRDEGWEVCFFSFSHLFFFFFFTPA